MKPNRPQQNWTPYPNNLLDNLEMFTGNEFKVVSLMIRKNLGYDDPNMQFSVRYVCLKTGMSKPTALAAINGLINKETIKVTSIEKRGLRLFDVNWDQPVKKLDRSKNLTTTGKESLPDPVKKLDQVKETILEENKVKDNTPQRSAYGENKRILLTTLEYDKLTERWGKVYTTDLISKMDGYCVAEGKKYKSFYQALINWSKKEFNKPPTHSETTKPKYMFSSLTGAKNDK